VRSDGSSVWDLGTALGHFQDLLATVRLEGTKFDRVFIERSNEMIIATGSDVFATKLYRP